MCPAGHKKAWEHIGRNVVEITIKMKTLNDKNHQLSSQKFRQLEIIRLFFCLIGLTLLLYLKDFIIVIIINNQLCWWHVEKKLNGNYAKMLCVVLNKSWKQHPKETAAVWPPTSHLTNNLNKMNKTCRALLEK